VRRCSPRRSRGLLLGRRDLVAVVRDDVEASEEEFGELLESWARRTGSRLIGRSAAVPCGCGVYFSVIASRITGFWAIPRSRAIAWRASRSPREILQVPAIRVDFVRR
jgi:hypothetical protein